MKNKLAKPDIALMSFAISVSKKAAVVATIKYGRVMVSNGDVDVELQFESQLDEFQIMLVPEKMLMVLRTGNVPKFPEHNFLKITMEPQVPAHSVVLKKSQLK